MSDEFDSRDEFASAFALVALSSCTECAWHVLWTVSGAPMWMMPLGDRWTLTNGGALTLYFPHVAALAEYLWDHAGQRDIPNIGRLR